MERIVKGAEVIEDNFCIDCIKPEARTKLRALSATLIAAAMAYAQHDIGPESLADIVKAGVASAANIGKG
jgi:hypothetical protein